MIKLLVVGLTVEGSCQEKLSLSAEGVAHHKCSRRTGKCPKEGGTDNQA